MDTPGLGADLALLAVGEKDGWAEAIDLGELVLDGHDGDGDRWFRTGGILNGRPRMMGPIYRVSNAACTAESGKQRSPGRVVNRDVVMSQSRQDLYVRAQVHPMQALPLPHFRLRYLPVILQVPFHSSGSTLTSAVPALATHQRRRRRDIPPLLHSPLMSTSIPGARDGARPPKIR
jgi:hypothetical protein